MADRRVVSAAPSATAVGSATIIGSALAEVPFVIYGLLAGQQVGSYPIGLGGATITGLRGWIYIPSARVGPTITVTVWKIPRGTITPVATAATLDLPINTHFERTRINVPLAEGDIMFIKTTTSAYIYDCWGMTFVVEF